MITRLAISGYRSLRDVTLRLGPITVVTGQNGSGKSSLYRSLRLLADVADGGVVRSLAAEGGIASALWAGPEAFSRAMRARAEPVQGTVRTKAVAMRLGFASDDYGYAIDLGLPQPSPSFFSRDPAIKAEALWAGQSLTRRTVLAERRGAAFRLRSRADGGWSDDWNAIGPVDSMLVQGAGPGGRSRRRGGNRRRREHPQRHASARLLQGDGRRVGGRRRLVRAPQDHFYGERSGTIRDHFDYDWLIGHAIKEVEPEEMQRRYAAMLSGN